MISYSILKYDNIWRLFVAARAFSVFYEICEICPLFCPTGGHTTGARERGIIKNWLYGLLDLRSCLLYTSDAADE